MISSLRIFTTLISSVSQASTFHDFLRFVYPGYAIFFPWQGMHRIN